MDPKTLSELNKALRKRFNVLIVDDVEEQRVLLADFFDPGCFNVLSARNYDEAVALIDSCRVPLHFLLIDLFLGPGKTGFDLLERYKNNYRFKLAMSGQADCREGGTAVELNALACLAKGGSDFWDDLAYYVCSYLPISFCSDGKIRDSLEMFEHLHKQPVYLVKDWAEYAHISDSSLFRNCKEQTGLTPEQVIFIHYGIHYFLRTFPRFNTLKKPTTLIPPPTEIFRDECFLGLLDYCRGKK